MNFSEPSNKLPKSVNFNGENCKEYLPTRNLVHFIGIEKVGKKKKNASVIYMKG